MSKLYPRLTAVAGRQALFALGLLATAALTIAPPPAFGQDPRDDKVRSPGTERPYSLPGSRDRKAPDVKAKAEALFDKLDKNHDGKVSREEFRRALARIPGLKLSAATADKLFARLDTNRDGFLTKDEIKRLPARLKGAHPDLNKGTLKKLFDKLKGLAVGKIADRLKAADKDHDGKLSKEEFRALLLGLKLPKVTVAVADKLFAQLDTSRDGFLTPDETKHLSARLKELVPGLGKGAVKAVLDKVKGSVLGKVRDAVLGKLKGIF